LTFFFFSFFKEIKKNPTKNAALKDPISALKDPQTALKDPISALKHPNSALKDLYKHFLFGAVSTPLRADPPRQVLVFKGAALKGFFRGRKRAGQNRA
jgi:hypothetical protein